MRWLNTCSGLLPTGLAFVIGGCGAGGEVGAAGGEQMSLVLPGVAAEDGVVLSDLVTVRTDGTLPQVGDLGSTQSNRVAREFLSFDLASVPANAVVVSAILRVDQYVVVGTPYAFGQVVVDHLDYGTLDGSDFAARALREGLGPLATDPSLGPRTLDVTEAVAQDVALHRARSQFRLRFSPLETDQDTENDFASFAEADAASSGQGQAPVLVVVVRH